MRFISFSCHSSKYMTLYSLYFYNNSINEDNGTNWQRFLNNQCWHMGKNLHYSLQSHFFHIEKNLDESNASGLKKKAIFQLLVTAIH